MDDKLYQQIREVFDKENKESGFFVYEELYTQCRNMSMVITMILLNHHRKKPLKPQEMSSKKITTPMNLASLWGLHTFLKQFALRGGYISPGIYSDKEKIKHASLVANDTLTKTFEIDKVGEEIFDKFTEDMMPSVKDTGMKISKEVYLSLLEANLKWGYAFGRELCK